MFGPVVFGSSLLAIATSLALLEGSLLPVGGGAFYLYAIGASTFTWMLERTLREIDTACYIERES